MRIETCIRHELYAPSIVVQGVYQPGIIRDSEHVWKSLGVVRETTIKLAKSGKLSADSTTVM